MSVLGLQPPPGYLGPFTQLYMQNGYPQFLQALANQQGGINNQPVPLAPGSPGMGNGLPPGGLPPSASGTDGTGPWNAPPPGGFPGEPSTGGPPGSPTPPPEPNPLGGQTPPTEPGAEEPTTEEPETPPTDPFGTPGGWGGSNAGGGLAPGEAGVPTPPWYVPPGPAPGGMPGTGGAPPGGYPGQPSTGGPPGGLPGTVGGAPPGGYPGEPLTGAPPGGLPGSTMGSGGGGGFPGGGIPGASVGGAPGSGFNQLGGLSNSGSSSGGRGGMPAGGIPGSSTGNPANSPDWGSIGSSGGPNDPMNPANQLSGQNAGVGPGIGGGMGMGGMGSPYPSSLPGLLSQSPNLTGQANAANGASGFLNGVFNQFQTAQNAANQANQQRANQIMQGYGNLQQQQGNLLGGLAGLYGQRTNDFASGASNVLGNYGNLLQQQTQGLNNIGQGYGNVLNTLLGNLNLLGQTQAQDINQQYTQAQDQAQQDLVNRGLGNTTITQNTQRAYDLDKQRALTNLAQNVAAQTNQTLQSGAYPALQFQQQALGTEAGLAGQGLQAQQSFLPQIAGLQGDALNFGNNANLQQTQLGQNQLNFLGSINQPGPDYNTLANLAMGIGAAGMGYGQNVLGGLQFPSVNSSFPIQGPSLPGLNFQQPQPQPNQQNQAQFYPALYAAYQQGA